MDDTTRSIIRNVKGPGTKNTIPIEIQQGQGIAIRAREQNWQDERGLRM